MPEPVLGPGPRTGREILEMDRWCPAMLAKQLPTPNDGYESGTPSHSDGSRVGTSASRVTVKRKRYVTEAHVCAPATGTFTSQSAENNRNGKGSSADLGMAGSGAANEGCDGFVGMSEDAAAGTGGHANVTMARRRRRDWSEGAYGAIARQRRRDRNEGGSLANGNGDAADMTASQQAMHQANELADGQSQNQEAHNNNP